MSTNHRNAHLNYSTNRSRLSPAGHGVRSQLEKLLFVTAVCVFLWWVCEQIKSRDITFQTGAIDVRLQGPFLRVARVRVLQASKIALGEKVTYDGLRSLEGTLRAWPWVRDVQIERVWPGGVNIRVVEHVPVAHWGDNGLLSEQGVVFAPSIMPDGMAARDLPKLHAADEKRAQNLLTLYRRLRDIVKVGGMRVTELREDERLEVEMRLNDRIRVVVGNKDQESRVRNMVAVHGALVHDALTPDDIKYMDLRYPTGVAVRYQRENTNE